MNRRVKRQQSLVQPESIHFRLCHMCLHLNESAQEIHRCERCAHDYYCVSDYLMSETIDLAGEDEPAEVETVNLEKMAERARSRGGRRLNGLVAIL